VSRQWQGVEEGTPKRRQLKKHMIEKPTEGQALLPHPGRERVGILESPTLTHHPQSPNTQGEENANGCQDHFFRIIENCGIKKKTKRRLWVKGGPQQGSASGGEPQRPRPGESKPHTFNRGPLEKQQLGESTFIPDNNLCPILGGNV